MDVSVLFCFCLCSCIRFIVFVFERVDSFSLYTHTIKKFDSANASIGFGYHVIILLSTLFSSLPHAAVLLDYLFFCFFLLAILG